MWAIVGLNAREMRGPPGAEDFHGLEWVERGQRCALRLF